MSLSFFQPLSSPCEYVCDSKPEVLDPSNDHTERYMLWIRCWPTALTRDLVASHLTSPATPGPTKKEKHCWQNWDQFNHSDLATKANCDELIKEVWKRVVNVCCKHIRVFDSSRRKNTLKPSLVQHLKPN